jgi:hypothetical protein
MMDLAAPAICQARTASTFLRGRDNPWVERAIAMKLGITIGHASETLADIARLVALAEERA